MKKNILIILSITIFFCIAYLGISWMIKRNNFLKVAEAVSGFPYQIGLSKVNDIILCQPSCCDPVCVCCKGEDGTLCQTVLPPCLYTEVSGIPSGGMGNRALFSNSALLKAGITVGSQLIAGGMTMVSMDSGVLAGPGGVYGGK